MSKQTDASKRKIFPGKLGDIIPLHIMSQRSKIIQNVCARLECSHLFDYLLNNSFKQLLTQTTHCSSNRQRQVSLWSSAKVEPIMICTLRPSFCAAICTNVNGTLTSPLHTSMRCRPFLSRRFSSNISTTSIRMLESYLMLPSLPKGILAPMVFPFYKYFGTHANPQPKQLVRWTLHLLKLQHQWRQESSLHLPEVAMTNIAWAVTGLTGIALRWQATEVSRNCAVDSCVPTFTKLGIWWLSVQNFIMKIICR